MGGDLRRILMIDPLHTRPNVAPMTNYLHANAKAAAWMSGWLVFMVTMAVAGRETVNQLNAFQVMELRAIIGIFLIMPLVMRAGGFAAMKTAHPIRHISRNVVHYFAQWAWLIAVTLIPLAQVVSIEFTMPIWTAILAVIFIGETMNRWKVLAIILGVIGVWIIVRPGLATVESGQLFSLAAAMGFSVSVVLVKALTRTEGVVRIIFWMLIIQAILGIIPAYLVWQPVPGGLWPWLVVVAICGTFSHYCMAQALSHADSTVVVPMDFLRVPVTALVGWMVYSEIIDAWTATGAALILLGNLLNLRSTAQPDTRSDS